MTKQYDDTNTGVLFKNTKKQTDSQPDYTGKINVKGEELALAGWIKQNKNGGNRLALKVTEGNYQKPSSVPQETGLVDDDIPFN